VDFAFISGKLSFGISSYFPLVAIMMSEVFMLEELLAES